MSIWMLVFPLIAAVIGWLIASLLLKLIFQRIVPSRQNEFAQSIGKMAASFVSVEDIEQKITHPDNVKKIMPQAEEHIDQFLRVRLVKEMPVVGMFVGDKTINQLKSLFIKELEQLFPEIMKNYMSRLQEDFNIEQLLATKVSAIPPATIENTLRNSLKKEITQVKLAFALLAFFIAGLQLVVFYFLQR
ncbi:MAG: DUF445 domain-containing protein [Chitinophagaceae bacterium]